MGLRGEAVHHLPTERRQIGLGHALVDDQEDVDLAHGLDGLERQQLGCAGPDADQEEATHVSVSAPTGHVVGTHHVLDGEALREESRTRSGSRTRSASGPKATAMTVHVTAWTPSDATRKSHTTERRERQPGVGDGVDDARDAELGHLVDAGQQHEAETIVTR